MLEIEVKAPCDDLGKIERTLGDLGARFIKEVVQSDVYLSHPSRDFGATDEALRLRREGDRYTLYYKGPKLDRETKTREELASPVPEPESLKLILKRLGFGTVAEVEKRRRIYMLRDVEVSLDQVKGLGGFVELEVQDREIEEGKAMIRALMKELGLEKTERSSYLELILDKG
jgi:adenylate cyclase class 2